MSKKSTLSGSAVVLVILAAPFIWFYEKFGAVGYVLLALAGLILAVSWAVLHAKEKEKRFKELVIYVLNHRLTPNEARKLNRNLASSNFDQASLIRNLQVLRDSIDISLSSKKRETAEQRYWLVVSRYEDIVNSQSSLIDPETMGEINRVVESYRSRFWTSLFKNVAEGHLAKAESLKTNKSKLKYSGMAMELISEGLAHPETDKEALHRIERDIEAFAQGVG